MRTSPVAPRTAFVTAVQSVKRRIAVRWRVSVIRVAAAVATPTLRCGGSGGGQDGCEGEHRSARQDFRAHHELRVVREMLFASCHSPNGGRINPPDKFL